MKRDILFIHPGNHKKTYQNLANEYTAVASPVWTLLLADYIQRKGYSAAIYDTNIEGWSDRKAEELLSIYNPELVTIMVYGHNPSASTHTMPAASHIAADIKLANNNIPLAMGGLHPTALPERTLREEQIDFVIRGEGAYPIKDLLEYIIGKKSLSAVKGVSYYGQNKDIIHNMSHEIIENLDDVLGGYAWDLLPPLAHYRAHNSHTIQYFEESQRSDFSDVRSPYAVLYTSLGCPYNCSYCCINSLFGKSKIRYWSLEKVMGWIDILVNEYGVKHIRLDDELFVLNAKRVDRFCDMLIERKYDLNLWAYSRVDTVKNRLLKKMKKAGFNWLCLGIEAADKHVMKEVNKYIKNDIADIVRSIQDSGMHVLGNYMFGLPDDTKETMKSTLNLAMELNCEFANFYTTTAYPGSALYAYWIKENPGVLPDTWNGFSQHSYETQPLPTKYLSPKDILEFRDRSFETYFTGNKYLPGIEQTFGNKALHHIQGMTRIKLKRKLLTTGV